MTGRPVIVSPDAHKDIAGAYAWYEDKVPGLGVQFMHQIEVVIGRLALQPEAYPPVHKQVRRALLRRFPYGLFYIYEPEEVTVLAVLHQAKDPRRWAALE